MTKQTYTLADVAERWGCSHSSVLMLVRSGQLVAIDISTNPSKRSHYVIRADDLEEFEQRRKVTPLVPKSKRRRPKVRHTDIIEFIK